MNRILSSSQHKIDKLSRLEKEVFDQLVEDIVKYKNKNITNMADELFCSPATIVTLLKKLGYYSFSEFKVVLNSYEVAKVSDFTLENKLLKKTATEISDTIATLDITQINLIAKDIISAQNILIVGFKLTYFTAREFAYKLSMLGVRSTAIENYDELDYKLASDKTIDYIIFLSFSGENTSVHEILDRNKITFDLMVTSNQNSSLKSKCKNTIPAVRIKDSLSNLFDHTYSFDVHSRVAIAAILRIIFDQMLYFRVKEGN